MTKKMNKYIDAEKLIAKIKKRINILDVDRPFGIGGRIELELVLDTITSLQQEQQEVDFEKELDRIWFDNKFGDRFDNSAVDFANVREICRHFYELRHNARKED